MREFATPSTSVAAGLRKVNMLDDCRRELRMDEGSFLDHTVVTPQALDDFTQFALAGAGDFAKGVL